MSEDREQHTPVGDSDRIRARMAGLDIGDPRYRVLKAALSFKASWVVLAEQLCEVYHDKLYRNWDYASFKDYCKDEIQIGSSMARKLVKGYQWLDQQAPDYLPRHINDEGAWEPPEREVPDYNKINVLADAKKAVEEEKVSADDYEQLKKKAFEGEDSAASLRRDFKESIPEHLRNKRKTDPLRPIKRALAAADKVVERLQESDDEESDDEPAVRPDEDVVQRAVELRDRLYQMISRKQQELEERAEEPDDDDPDEDAADAVPDSIGGVEASSRSDMDRDEPPF